MKHLRNSNLVDPVDLWDVSSVQSSETFGYMNLNIYIYICYDFILFVNTKIHANASSKDIFVGKRNMWISFGDWCFL